MENVPGPPEENVASQTHGNRLVPGNAKPTASRRSASVPPYNPGLDRLVEGKQTWSVPLSPQARSQGFLGWHQRGYLPHRDAPGLVQFVTFRLADSLPAARRCEWEALLRIEDDRRRRALLETYLDRGHGQCWLRQPRIASLAEGALRCFDQQRYELLAWVVMPNHVHVLLQVCEIPLARLIQSWKRLHRPKPGEGGPCSGCQGLAVEQRTLSRPVREPGSASVVNTARWERRLAVGLRQPKTRKNRNIGTCPNRPSRTHPENSLVIMCPKPTTSRRSAKLLTSRPVD
jgi:hypothetical protein